jgi:hypothetical protein
MVVAASGTARLLLGSDAADPNLRFAVAVADPAGAFTNRLAIDRDGNTTVRGQLRVIDHDVMLTSSGGEAGRTVGRCERQPDQGAIDAQRTVPAVSFPVPSLPSESPRPWTAYRAPVTAAGGPRIDQLSFETGAPEGNEDPARYRLAVGFEDADGEFSPCLTVDAGCTVRIKGTLEVTGKLSHGPLRADPADPTFVAAMSSAWLIGAAARSAEGTGHEEVIT